MYTSGAPYSTKGDSFLYEHSQSSSAQGRFGKVPALRMNDLVAVASRGQINLDLVQGHFLATVHVKLWTLVFLHSYVFCGTTVMNSALLDFY